MKFNITYLPQGTTTKKRKNGESREQSDKRAREQCRQNVSNFKLHFHADARHDQD